MPAAHDPNRETWSVSHPTPDGVVVDPAAVAEGKVRVHPERVRVVLLDERCAPVSGARVTLEARQVVLGDSLLLGDVPGLLKPLVEITLADGEVYFRDVADVTYRVTASCDGYVGRTGLEARPGEDLRVTMRAGRTIRGQVMDGDSGGPVVGATVRGGGVDWDHREASDVTVLTDDEGRFVLLGVGDHATEITVTAPWYPMFSLDLSPEVPSPVFVMRRALRRLAGRVIEAASRDPVGGVRVLGGGAEAVTDTEGGFSLTGVAIPNNAPPSEPMCSVAIRLERTGYASASIVAEFAAHVAAGEVQAVDGGTIELMPRGALTGVLLDPAGGAVVGAMLALAPAGANVTAPGVLRMCAIARTDTAGRFRFSDRPDTPGVLHLVALVPGFAAAIRAIAPGDSRVTMRLRQGIDVTLAVRSAAAAHRTVILEERGADGRGVRSTVRRRSGRTDESGRVLFRGLRPGHVRVSIPGIGVTDLEVGSSVTRDISFATSSR